VYKTWIFPFAALVLRYPPNPRINQREVERELVCVCEREREQERVSSCVEARPTLEAALPLWGQIVFFKRLDVHHRSPDSVSSSTNPETKKCDLIRYEEMLTHDQRSKPHYRCGDPQNDLSVLAGGE